MVAAVVTAFTLKLVNKRDFPPCPVFKTAHFCARSVGLTSGQGPKIPHGTQRNRKPKPKQQQQQN